ncbi:hypothetical protein bcgnr5378_06110 [Bacillus cereus]
MWNSIAGRMFDDLLPEIKQPHYLYGRSPNCSDIGILVLKNDRSETHELEKR